MNRDEMIKTAYQMPPDERAADVIRWVGDMISGHTYRLPPDPMEEVFAIQRIAQGLLDLANAKGAKLREKEWIEPMVDPIGAMEQAKTWAERVRGEFQRSIS